jgi:hypothetical protein
MLAQFYNKVMDALHPEQNLKVVSAIHSCSLTVKTIAYVPRV